MTEEQYIQKGFNHGYQLQKHQPELAQQLQQGFADKNTPYAQGFTAGSQEYSKEKAQENTPYRPTISRNRSPKSKDKGKGFDL